MKKIISIAIIIMLLCTTAIVYAEVPSNSRNINAIVVGGWLRLRSGPGYNYETIASYPNGSVIRVLSTSGDWCRIQDKDGTIGFMSRYYLNKTNLNPGNIQQLGGYEAYIYSANGGNVRLRSGPNFNYGVIGSYPYGMKLYVINHGLVWDYVRIGSQYGYIKNEFISISGNPNPFPNNQASYTAYVTSKNGYGVRVRNNPSMNANIVGFYSVGTQVDVITHNFVNGWDKISVGGKVAFIMNRFLTKNPSTSNQTQNYNLIDVTLNKLNAKVGDDLYVVGTNPSGAKVNYVWKLDNTVISYSNGIIVPASAQNKIIVLEAEGTSGYSGKVIKTVSIGNTIPMSPKQISDVMVVDRANAGDTISVTQVYPWDATVQYYWNYDGVTISNTSSCKVPNGSENKTIELLVQGIGQYKGSVYKTIKINESPKPVDPPTTYSIVLDKDSYNVGDTIQPSVSGAVLSSPTYDWYIDGFLVSYAYSYTVAQEDSGKTIEIRASFIDSNSNNQTIIKKVNIN